MRGSNIYQKEKKKEETSIYNTLEYASPYTIYNELGSQYI